MENVVWWAVSIVLMEKIMCLQVILIMITNSCGGHIILVIEVLAFDMFSQPEEKPLFGYCAV